MERNEAWPRFRLRRVAAVLAPAPAFAFAFACLLLASAWLAASRWDQPKRLRIVVPGRLIGGAWQSPTALESIIEGARIRTLVTLTAINRDDLKYVTQSKVVGRTGVAWILVPMRGSTATLEQMAVAADLMADSSRQPLYFHCVAGHHRTSLAHAAYLIRHAGYSGQRAWEVVAGLPWARPGAPADDRDRRLILEFARVQASILTTPPAPEAVGRP